MLLILFIPLFTVEAKPFIADVADDLALLKLLVMLDAIFDVAELAALLTLFIPLVTVEAKLFIADDADDLALLKLLVILDAIFDDAALADEAAELSSDVTLLDNPLAEPLAFACIALKFDVTPLLAACAALVALACAFFMLLDTPADKLSA